MQLQESDGPVWEKPGLTEGSFQIAAAFASPAPVVTVALAAWGNSCVLREGILMLAPGHKVPLAWPVLEGREELGPFAPEMRPAPIVHDPQMQPEFNTQHDRIPKDAEGNLLRSVYRENGRRKYRILTPNH